ncbi:MAG: transposase [Actinomycetota bacterium]
MAKNRTYTDEQRAKALRLYTKVGPAEASRQLGIPSPTIRKWAQLAGASSARADRVAAAVEAAKLTWEQRRGALTDKCGEAAEEFLARARESNPSNASFLMRAFDLAIKSASLLSGDPTERVAVSDLEREIDRELRQLAAARERNAELATPNGDSG